MRIRWYGLNRITGAKKEYTMRVMFTMDKATKNTIRFKEDLEKELDAPKIGTIYIPKGTLGTIKWTDGKTLVVELSVGEDKA